jgi:hypothetical protein
LTLCSSRVVRKASTHATSLTTSSCAYVAGAEKGEGGRHS